MAHQPSRAAALGGALLCCASFGALPRSAGGGELPAGTEAAASTTVVAGPQYAASGVHRLLFGSDYRALWTTPVVVPWLDLGAEAGGLTPVRRVGGEQTLGLAFKGADGRSYTFRALAKDPAGALPADLHGTFAEGLIRDQVAAGHPGAALVVAPLLEAAGVLHVESRLVMMPDDQRLGEFRAAFAGQLGTIELFPTPGFSGATEILGADGFASAMQGSSRDWPDARAYLRARLMDHWLGDWDRHRGQWRWARIPGQRGLQPIPEDRDQAFARYEGLLLGRARRLQPQLVTFSGTYPGMEGLSWNGREQDRRLLGPLDRDDYDAVAGELAGALDDRAIAAALMRLPPEWRERDGERFERALRSRRGRMSGAARKFYRQLAAEADIHLSDENETVELRRDRRGEIELVARRAADGEIILTRRFRRDDTREIRLYLHGGDDRVLVTGTAAGPRLRVIGGPGTDELNDREGGGTQFYDEDPDGKVSPGRGTHVEARTWSPDLPNPQAPWIPPRDYGRRADMIPLLSYSSDDGAVLGFIWRRRVFGFRKLPEAELHRVELSWGTLAQRPHLEYTGIHRSEHSRSWLALDVLASGSETQRYHGIGNETTDDAADAYYRVEQQRFRLAPSWSVAIGDDALLALGARLEYSDLRDEEGSLIDEAPAYGAGNFGQAGFTAEFALDTRASARELGDGVRVAIGGSLQPEWLDVRETFGEIHGELGGFWQALPGFQIAARAGGRQVWGDAPFNDLAYIGGSDTVRGFDRRRFRGDAALHGRLELRLKLGRPQILVPADVGIFGLVDSGRVFVEGEDSSRWHTGYGGGLWFAPLRSAGTIRLAIASSDERLSVYLGAGFSF